MKLSDQEREQLISQCDGRTMMVKLLDSAIGTEFIRCLKEERMDNPKSDSVEMLKDALRFFVSQIGAPLVGHSTAEKNAKISIGGVLVCSDMSHLADQMFQTIAVEILKGGNKKETKQ